MRSVLFTVSLRTAHIQLKDILSILFIPISLSWYFISVSQPVSQSLSHSVSECNGTQYISFHVQSIRYTMKDCDCVSAHSQSLYTFTLWQSSNCQNECLIWEMSVKSLPFTHISMLIRAHCSPPAFHSIHSRKCYIVCACIAHSANNVMIFRFLSAQQSEFITCFPHACHNAPD